MAASDVEALPTAIVARRSLAALLVSLTVGLSGSTTANAHAPLMPHHQAHPSPYVRTAWQASLLTTPDDTLETGATRMAEVAVKFWAGIITLLSPAAASSTAQERIL